MSGIPSFSSILENISWPTLLAAYDHLTLHVVPGPRSLSYFVPFLALPGILFVPPSVLSHSSIRWIILPLVYAFQAYVWHAHNSFDVISMDHALMMFVLLGYYDVRKTFKRITKAPEADTEALSLEPYPSDLWRRLQWVATLSVSLQLSNFVIGSPAHDRKQESRLRQRKAFKPFALRVLTLATLIYLNLDTLSLRYEFLEPILLQHHDLESTRYKLLASAYDSAHLLEKLWMALALWTFYSPCLMVLSTFYLLPDLRNNISVSPLFLPEPYGSISSIWTPSATSPTWGLRAFWGTFWHQNMRYITSAPGMALADGLGLGRGSTARYVMVTSSAFFWSGAIHAGMVPSQPVGTRYTSTELRLLVASFFWIQALGVGLETLLDRHWRRTMEEGVVKEKQSAKPANGPASRENGETRAVQVLRFSKVQKAAIVVWTAGFLAATAWSTARLTGEELGWWRIHETPISAVAWLRGEEDWYRRWI